MIEATTSQPPLPSSAHTAAALPAAPGGFALTLDAYLDAAAPSPGSPLPPASERQGDADSGKSVPQDAQDSADKDHDAGTAWLPAVTPPVLIVLPGPVPIAGANEAQPGAVAPGISSALPSVPVPAHEPRSGLATDAAPAPVAVPADTIESATPGSANPAITASPQPSRGGATESPGGIDASVVSDPAVAPVSQAQGSGQSSPTTLVPTDGLSPPVARDADPARTSPPAPAVILAAPRGGPLAVNPIQPARQAFAAALAALSIAPRRPRSLTDDAVPASLTAPDASRPVSLSTVQAADDTGAASLNLQQDRGIEQMIDHIEALRDDADASDTRIRLVPDALGTVDIAVRKQGDAVHVHFAADSDATRAALADAQPRLAQLAETRGVRIAGTSIDSGTGTGTGTGNAQPQPRRAFTRPAPAPGSAGSAADPTTDQRLA